MKPQIANFFFFLLVIFNLSRAEDLRGSVLNALQSSPAGYLEACSISTGEEAASNIYCKSGYWCDQTKFLMAETICRAPLKAGELCVFLQTQPDGSTTEVVFPPGAVPICDVGLICNVNPNSAYYQRCLLRYPMTL